MNTAFLSLYKVSNQSNEIGDRIHIKFTGPPFSEHEPEFSVKVPYSTEYVFERGIYAYPVASFPTNVAFSVAISSATLSPFTVGCVASYAGSDDTTMVVNIVPTGYPPTAVISLHFKKYSRTEIANEDYYSGLLDIAPCLSRLLLWESEILGNATANSHYAQLKTSLQTLYAKLNAISQDLDYSDIVYHSDNPFSNNFFNMLERLQSLQPGLEYEKDYTELSDLKAAYDDFIAKYNQLKSDLNSMGIAPCDTTPPNDIWGPLDDDFRSRLSCFCKILALDSTVSAGIQTMINLMKSKLTSIYAKLDSFVSSQGTASANVLNDNYKAVGHYDLYTPGATFCDKANDIATLLEWVNKNRQYLVDTPPNTVNGLIADISSDLNALSAIFAELEFALPGVCKDFVSDYDWGNSIVQSPYMYLQACGAASADAFSEGIHLRWSLLKEIGENHIPKGDLANTAATYYANYGYTKDNDYVKLRKTLYADFAVISIDFSTTNPRNILDDVPNNRYTWTYSKSSTTSVTSRKFENEIYIHFANKVLYDTVRVSIDPAVSALAFLKAYTDYIEVEVKNKLMFAWKFEVANQLAITGLLKYEAINLPDPSDILSKRITIRKTASGITFNETGLGENISSLRLKFETSAYLSKLHLETYYDFLSTRTAGDWSSVGDFGLTLDNTTAYNRLDNGGALGVDGEWPKYHDNVVVKVQNYKDKWTATDGLKAAVTDYLDLSKTDVRATDILESQDSGDESKLPIDYIDILGISALDFHNARMLGLGHIDAPGSTQKYVYRAYYRTHPGYMENRGIPLQDHFYMSLPTDRSDLRLPLKPEIGDVTYGLEGFDECTLSKFQKEDGYAKYDNTRFINIYRDKYDYEIAFESFFQQANLFNIAELALPVFYGIKYKELGGAYQKPDLVNSPDYLDTNTSGSPSTVNEVTPVIDTGAKLYTHFEQNEGVHKYSIYGINWFSRITPLSDEVTTDDTAFEGNEKLLPPSRIHAHYIQEEESLMFTTLAEQEALEDRIAATPSADNYQTRVTFNWNHLQQINYPDADTVEFFYRPELPMEVEGKIQKVVSLGNGLYDVYSESFVIVSKDPAETITPTLSSGNFGKFSGSKLLCSDGVFIVDSVQSGTSGPVFRIKAEIRSQNTLNADGGSATPICVPVIPTKGILFQVLENLAAQANWNKLDRTVTIVKHTNLIGGVPTVHEETIDGINYEIAGIYGDVVMVADTGTDPIAGLFKITYNSVAYLADHPQKSSGVEWYKGTARVPDTTGEIHEMDVWAIDKTPSTNFLIIWAYDPTYGSGYSYDLNASAPFINVNFHPGYKVYLSAESTHNFDQGHIMPAAPEVKKENLLALRAKNSGLTPNPKSRISVPAVFMGLNIREPVKPQKPLGPAFATRPDLYGKSSYTIDVKIEDEPFAYVYYRASEFMLLSSIYTAETILEVYDAIEALEDNSFDSNRFSDLANAILDPVDDSEGKIQFKEYNGYRLPNTFKSSIETPAEGTTTTLEERVINAINTQYVGLTPDPIVYELVKTTTGLRVTSNNPPVTKDERGRELSKTDPLFNAHPYAIKYTEGADDYIRFTDYTLDGASVDRYYYIVAEITREQKIGEKSDALGPIRMVNAFPPEAPYIQKYESVLASPSLGVSAGARFYVNPYIPDEHVEKLAIYRTLDVKESDNVSLMSLACTLDFNSSSGFVDNFTDLQFPPFGKDIFYRLVALRKIKNELDEDEFIPSKPSELVKTKVIDNVNPPAPVIAYGISNVHINPPVYENVVLVWSQTCFQGKYNLYKMSDSGFWQLVKSYTYEDTLEYRYSFLNREDRDGDRVYHRFKVVAENPNGLLSLEEQVLVINDPSLGLDQFKATDVAVAYSLRRLIGTFEGPCLKVRNDSNVESDIPFTYYKLDEDALLAHTTSGDGHVARWMNQAGNASLDFIQPDAGAQPLIADAGDVCITAYEKPGILFSDSGFSGLQSAFNTVNKNYTCYIVTDVQDTDGNMRIRLTDSSNGDPVSETTVELGLTADKMLIALYYDHANEKLTVKVPGSTTIIDYNHSENLLGLYFNDTDTFNGSISEFIVLNKNLRITGKDIDTEKEIKTYWGLNGLEDELPLDAFNTADIAAACSLRKLISGYSGPGMKVRNDSEAELEIPFDGNEFNTTILLTHAGSGDGHVTRFIDQSGHSSLEFIQDTDTRQPLIVVDGEINLASYGKPGLLFNDTALSLMQSAFSSSGKSFTIYMVVDVQDGDGDLRVVVRDSVNGDMLSEDSISLGLTAHNMLLAIYYSHSDNIVSIRVPGGTMDIAFDSNNNLLSLFTKLGDAFTGSVSEIIVLNKDLRATSAFEDMENDIIEYWGLNEPEALLLDEVDSEDISVAYSLRRLLTDYAGSAIKVRNDDDDELEIPFKGFGMDQAALLEHVGSGNGRVSRFINQKGNAAADFIQATESKQPYIAEAGVIDVSGYGKPGLRFKYPEQTHMKATYTVGEDFTIYMVIDVTGGAGGIMELSSSLANSIQFYFDSGWRLRVNDNSSGSVYDPTIPTGTGIHKVLMALYYNNTTKSLCAKLPGVTRVYTLPAVRIAYTGSDNLLGLYSNLSDALSGSISELIILNKDMRALGKDAEMENNITKYWNLYKPESLMLDSLSSTDISVAYSLRKLLKNYSGSAIRVRNGSNVETDIAFVDNELDTARILTHVSSGDGRVVKFIDQIGNSGSDFTQATAANQPYIATAGTIRNGTYGKPGIFFKYTDPSYLQASYTVGENFSMYMVIDVQGGAGGIMELSAGLYNSLRFYFDGGFRIRLNDNSGGNVSDATIGNSTNRMKVLAVMYYNNTTKALCIKVPGTTNNYTLPAARIAYTSSNNLMGIYSNMTDALSGYISELIILNEDMRIIGKDGEFEANIKGYWGVL